MLMVKIKFLILSHLWRSLLSSALFDNINLEILTTKIVEEEDKAQMCGQDDIQADSYVELDIQNKNYFGREYLNDIGIWRNITEQCEITGVKEISGMSTF
ncbi:hypothetical protein TNCT_212931 [Trichonephila clavata]|uniref:Uncharacterized protein n=1 Tax=Trichonephila clavata TaxID=2740835 RepID=A0A8X6FRB1_TRICU|nr:hypothetical protein TNCT_212931 [Trichonephila clavata]